MLLSGWLLMRSVGRGEVVGCMVGPVGMVALVVVVVMELGV